MVEIKTFGEKAQQLKEAAPPSIPTGGVPASTEMPPTPQQVSTFGDKVKYWNRQINLPRTPFNLSSWDFQNRKYYYLNRFGAWRNLDDEEALDKFHEACDQMRRSGEALQPAQNIPQMDVSTPPKEGEKRIRYAPDIPQSNRPAGMMDVPESVFNDIVKDIIKEQKTELAPQLNSQNRIARAKEIAEIFRRNGLKISEEQAVKLRKDSMRQFLEAIQAEFEEWFTPGRTQKDTNPNNVWSRVNKFLKSQSAILDAGYVGPDQKAAANKFYQNIPNFVNDIKDIYYDPETGMGIFDDINVRKTLNCQPFTLTNNRDTVEINDFPCFVNVIENRITVAARDNAGVSPYQILEKYVTSSEIKNEPDEPVYKTHGFNYDQEMEYNESVIHEAEGTTPKGSASYRQAMRTQRGGEIYSAPQRIGVRFKGEGETLLRVSPEQAKSFHNIMIEYFLKPGLLVYLLPQDYENMVQRGGAIPHYFKKLVGGLANLGNQNAKVQL